jgi:hypothetical protein
MADLWYYGHDDNKLGPCSGRQLKELAASGQILPTHTIWQEGREQGVSAARVKNLFPPRPCRRPPGRCDRPPG